MSWSDVRQILGYPLWMVGGWALTVVFAMRWRVTRCIGDRTAAMLAAGFGIMGIGGFLTLLTRGGSRAPLATWSAMYTLMMVGVGVGGRLHYYCWRSK